MSIKFPKLDWSSKAEELENAPPELSEEVYKVLKEDLDAITKKKSINPHEIQNGLRDINFKSIFRLLSHDIIKFILTNIYLRA